MSARKPPAGVDAIWWEKNSPVIRKGIVKAKDSDPKMEGATEQAKLWTCIECGGEKIDAIEWLVDKSMIVFKCNSSHVCRGFCDECGEEIIGELNNDCEEQWAAEWDGENIISAKLYYERAAVLGKEKIREEDFAARQITMTIIPSMEGGE